MDSTRARRLLEELEGLTISGWRVLAPIGHGKSALVMKAARGNQVAALKVFDPEIVERFGETVQLERVNRELSLKGKAHPNLVRILDGGKCTQTGFIFVAMELFEGWRTIADCLPDIHRSAIPMLIEHVAQAAHFLEQEGIVHRDIKPSNIVLSPDHSRAVLLDLGVARPLDGPKITDDADFIGTLQYASPEFLFGDAEESVEGWRALTFYQLGAVLHDLLTNHPLFDGIAPYSRLVEAVKNSTPRISSDLEHPRLVQLARNCLLKDPAQRLGLVKWPDFWSGPDSHSPMQAARDRVRARMRAYGPEALARPRSAEHAGLSFPAVVLAIRDRLQDACTANADFPPSRMAVHDNQISLLMSRSSKHRLPVYMHVLLSLSTPSVDAVVLSITCQAAVSSVGSSPPPETQYSRPVFHGAADIDIASEAIVHYLYLLLDQAQAIVENNPQPWPGTQIVWLATSEVRTP